jgi:hypothetical protein
VPQQKRRLTRTARELGFQVIACFFLRIESDFAAQALKLVGEECSHAVYSRFIVAGRLNFHHALEHRHHFRLVLLAESKVRKSGLALGFGGHIRMI